MKPAKSYVPKSAQRGASLIVVLVLLLVVTLLGLAVLRGTLLEERMTANMLDRSLGFQAAESALREAEELAGGAPVAPATGCTAAGVCSTPDATDTDRWLDSGFGGWVAATDDLGTLPAPASYFIEFMGMAPTWPGCDRAIPVADLCMAPRYRVTARSTAADRADVLLQTNFIVR
jgi:type IV pilus assembly protein PilX